MKKNDLYSQAFEYMVRGYSVMPLRKDKKPLLASWKQYQEKPADEEQIEVWWKKWPDANVGIITGRISGLTVVDVDTGGDEVVPLSKFPETLTIKTPTGGYHLYYKYDSAIKQTANTFKHLPHVDIRNDGGFVVAPPSRCEYEKNKEQIRGAYSILKKAAIAPFPQALFGMQPAEPHKRVKDILKAFPVMAEGDGRNVALTKVAGKVLKLVAVNEHEAVAWPIIAAANSRFKKPLAEKEVRIIFNSIAGKERDKPLAEIEFIRTDKGVIIANVENVCRTMRHDAKLEGHFRFNTFAGVVETDFQKKEFESFQRSDVSRVRSYLMSEYPHFTKIGHSEVEDAMLQVAEENKVSPPVEWLQSLVWDKKPRLDTWLTLTYGVEDNEYHRAVGANWLKGLAKRLVYPGCKFDYVLVLEGKQGIRKSTSLAILGGDWHVETVSDPNNKDFFMTFAGNAIVEFSEGETLSRTEAKRMKAVITMQFDKYRPPYERSVKNFPRQCVFAMTTNQEQYLKDETGNRRWLPVAIKQRVDIDWLKENRDQLYAEAYHRVVDLQETIHEFPEAQMVEEQQKRQISDPREDLIAEWYYHDLSDSERLSGVTARQAYVQGIQKLKADSALFAKQMDKTEDMVISSILKEVLKLEKRRERINGIRHYLYFPTNESEAMKPTKAEQRTASLML